MSEVPALEINGLVKRYGKVSALDGLNLTIPRGVIAGFIGLNGAGKTTTLRILLGMAKADAGSARILGLDALNREQSLEIRRRTAFVPERKELFPYMTVGEAIAFTRQFYPKWRLDMESRLMGDFGLKPEQGVSKISKGTLTKLQMLLAFCRGAELILLDEPTDGLDPLGVEVVMRSMVNLAGEEGVTILFSSHRLNEMEQVADFVGMIHKGRALENGASDEVRERRRRVVMTFPGAAAAQSESFAGDGVVRCEGRVMTVLADGRAESVMAKGQALGARTVEAETLTVREIFLELVKGDLN